MLPSRAALRGQSARLESKGSQRQERRFHVPYSLQGMEEHVSLPDAYSDFLLRCFVFFKRAFLPSFLAHEDVVARDCDCCCVCQSDLYMLLARNIVLHQYLPQREDLPAAILCKNKHVKSSLITSTTTTDGMTGSPKNASASSRKRTRSSRPTSRRTWMLKDGRPPANPRRLRSPPRSARTGQT